MKQLFTGISLISTLKGKFCEQVLCIYVSAFIFCPAREDCAISANIRTDVPAELCSF